MLILKSLPFINDLRLKRKKLMSFMCFTYQCLDPVHITYKIEIMFVVFWYYSKDVVFRKTSK